MVLRSYPIRVAGDSGPLPNETTWEDIAKSAGMTADIREYTTVTKKLRRVGNFDAELVRRAIDVNAPNRVVLNHLDYVGSKDELVDAESILRRFIADVEVQIGRKIDWYGFSGLSVVESERHFA